MKNAAIIFLVVAVLASLAIAIIPSQMHQDQPPAASIPLESVIPVDANAPKAPPPVPPRGLKIDQAGDPQPLQIAAQGVVDSYYRPVLFPAFEEGDIINSRLPEEFFLQCRQWLDTLSLESFDQDKLKGFLRSPWGRYEPLTVGVSDMQACRAVLASSPAPCDELKEFSPVLTEQCLHDYEVARFIYLDTIMDKRPLAEVERDMDAQRKPGESSLPLAVIRRSLEAMSDNGATCRKEGTGVMFSRFCETLMTGDLAACQKLEHPSTRYYCTNINLVKKALSEKSFDALRQEFSTGANFNARNADALHRARESGAANFDCRQAALDWMKLSCGGFVRYMQ